ncbi:hypothetical protein BC828DRAFT_395967 [Blastocladiella britannica]|nr:hypothetical protein BC828DRAFT_395967 [Blastocladiella britannica]
MALLSLRTALLAAHGYLAFSYAMTALLLVLADTLTWDVPQLRTQDRAVGAIALVTVATLALTFGSGLAIVWGRRYASLQSWKFGAVAVWLVEVLFSLSGEVGMLALVTTPPHSAAGTDQAGAPIEPQWGAILVRGVVIAVTSLATW